MTFTNDQLLCQLGVSWLDSTLWIILIGPFFIDGGRGSGNERTRGRIGMKARLEGGQCHQRLVAEDVSLAGTAAKIPYATYRSSQYCRRETCRSPPLV